MRKSLRHAKRVAQVAHDTWSWMLEEVQYIPSLADDLARAERHHLVTWHAVLVLSMREH